MANIFTKTEEVAFEDILQGFDDACVISKNVKKYGTDGQLMERSNDTIWRPSPYIMTSQDRTVGSAVTAQDAKQLSVPSSLGYKKNVTWELNSLELRDQLQENRLGKSAYQRLASDINSAVRDVVSLEGTLVNAVSGAAGDYDDIAVAESIMLEQGIVGDRCLGLTARDYNGMAGDLANRGTLNKLPTNAYERSQLGMIAGFDTLKLDAGKTIAAAGASSITVATNGAQVDYVPLSSQSTTAGEINVDNRYQSVTFSSTTGMVAGDAFTIANVNAVHHITKDDTTELKTFRIISVASGGTVAVISPPMIGATSSPTAAELQYKNIEVTAESATAAVVFLNTNASGANPFWNKESIEILPGRYAVPSNQGADILRGVTSQGLEVVMTKQFTGLTFESVYTLDVLFGVVNLNPEMNGIILWNQ